MPEKVGTDWREKEGKKRSDLGEGGPVERRFLFFLFFELVKEKY